MSHSLYMDVHVPWSVTEGLLGRGIDVLTSQDDQADRLDDEALLERATDLGRVLVTQDDDFLEIGPRWQQTAREFSGIIFAHQLRLGIGALIDELELIANCMEEHELQNQVIYLPMK